MHRLIRHSDPEGSRPGSLLPQPEPSPALDGREGGTRRLCRALRFRVGRATPRFVAGTARLPVVHGLVRLSWSEGSPAGLAPTRAGCGTHERTVCGRWWEPTLLAIADGAGKPQTACPPHQCREERTA